MAVKHNLQAILAELTHNLTQVKENQFQELVKLILAARHLFLAGAGRSGIAIQAFANRLMHLGLSVSLVGEITSPHSNPGDLLLIGSGSGETPSLVALAKKAQQAGVKIGLLTMDRDSTIAQLAEVVVELPGDSPKLKHHQGQVASIQPMGSAFEQLLFLSFDGLILELMPKLHETNATMFKRHADLE